uniref:Uncharacterized protein n=1 Tax=Rhizophora mucronata TaxID=61149 RepID=A0A2P2IMM6_RHIMU
MDNSVSVTEAGKLIHPKEEGNLVESDDDEKGEDRPSRLFNHIPTANLVSSKGEPGEKREDDAKDVKNQKKPGGGLLDHLISNLVAPLSPRAGAKQEKTINKEELVRVEEEDDQLKYRAGRGAGRIIENIVSHFPKSLPDDAAPSTDEASILIHSFIRD